MGLINDKINIKSQPLKNPLCVALDVDDRDQALKLVEELREIVGGFKLGPRLINKYGESLVQEISKAAPVFVDCKFFDIPSTMESAVHTAFHAGASLVTVHALSGKEALEKLAAVENELKKIRPFRVLAVTILTSWSQESLPPVLKPQALAEHVRQLAQLVQSSGLNSLVCSPEELTLLKDLDMFCLTPGIRFETDKKDDQKRIMGPAQALKNGSSALVVGRPIINAKSPKAAALDFLTAIYL